MLVAKLMIMLQMLEGTEANEKQICLQVPYESLKRVSRDRKYNIDDFDELVSSIQKVAERTCSEQERRLGIESLIQRATNLQKQV